MLAEAIVLFCTIQLSPCRCDSEILECVKKENQLRYEESQWRDVPNEETSMQSFQHCAEDYERNYPQIFIKD